MPHRPTPPAAKKTSSRPPWRLVGVLLIALVAVGSWIGLHLSSWKQETSTAMAPLPPPSGPMTANAPPAATVPPGDGGAAPASGNVAAAPGGATPPAAGASAPAASLTPLDNVPVIAPAPAPQANGATPPAAPAPGTPAPPGTPAEAALANSEVEDWNLAQAENTREGYEAYLRRYRRGLHAREARNAIAELNRLSAAVPAPPGTTPTNAVPTVVAAGTAPPGTPSATAPAAPPGTGRVVLNIRPWGQVYVDGAERGVSPPLKSLSLRPGIYNIEVRNGDLDVFRQRVTVQDSRSSPVVSHEFK
jgi:non-specific serine/threonine protein kinase